MRIPLAGRTCGTATAREGSSFLASSKELLLLLLLLLLLVEIASVFGRAVLNAEDENTEDEDVEKDDEDDAAKLAANAEANDVDDALEEVEARSGRKGEAEKDVEEEESDAECLKAERKSF